MIPSGSIASANDGFDQVVGWDGKTDQETHWLYSWSQGADKTLTIVRGFRAPVEILVVGGGAAGKDPGPGGSAGGLYHTTSWTFNSKETWAIPYVGSGGTTGDGQKTRIQNAANTAYIECAGGFSGSATGSVAWVDESGNSGSSTQYARGQNTTVGATTAYGGGGGATGNGSNAPDQAHGGDGGPGYSLSWWLFPTAAGGGGGGAFGGGAGGSTMGGDGGTVGANATGANGFSWGSGGGGTWGYGPQKGGSAGVVAVRVPKVLG